MSMRVATNTVEAVLEQYQQDLGKLYAQGEVRAIACAVFFDRLAWDAAELSMNRGLSLSESELLKVYMPLKRLRTGEPLQYVLGTVEFHGLQLAVDKRVLVPRPETEELVDLIISGQKHAPDRIIDIGTGSGCIALALKKAFPKAEVTGMDVSSDALDVARSNAERNGLSVEWIMADALTFDLASSVATAVGGRTLIVSNPPYVPKSEEHEMAINVREHEPHVALFVPDADPQLFYRAIATQAGRILRSGDELWFEGHHIHAIATGELVRALGFVTVEVSTDLSGRSRFIHAVK